MKISSDRPYDWIAALALASGATVIIPSVVAVAAAVLFIAMRVFSGG